MLRRAEVPLWGLSCPRERGDGHGLGLAFMEVAEAVSPPEPRSLSSGRG